MGSKENIRKSVKPSASKRESASQAGTTKGSKGAGTKAASTKTVSTKSASTKSASTKTVSTKSASTKSASTKSASTNAANTKGTGTKDSGAKQSPVSKTKPLANSKKSKIAATSTESKESNKVAQKKESKTTAPVSASKERRGKVNSVTSTLQVLRETAEQVSVPATLDVVEERTGPLAAVKDLDKELRESLPELPEFQSDRDLLEYFGIELFDPERADFLEQPKPPETLQEEEISNAELDPLVAGLTNFSPEDDKSLLDLDPIDELANLLATAEEAEAVKLSFEALHTLREEDIALKEVEVIRLSNIAFGRIHDAVVDLQEDANAIVSGKSQAFFHDRSSGKIYGEDVYAFVYDQATVQSHGSRVIAAGRAVVYAEDGWIGAKDDAFVLAQGFANVQASGDAIVIAEGSSVVEATGRAAVMVNSPLVKVRLLSDDASVILMDLYAQILELETLDRQPPKIHQLVSIESPLGLEKMMEISFREGNRKQRLEWDST